MREVVASEAGYVASIDGEALGLAVIGLGGGRQVESDRIDPSVGLSKIVRLGTRVEKGTPLAMVHAAREEAAEAAAAAVQQAIVIAPEKPAIPQLVHERIVR